MRKVFNCDSPNDVAERKGKCISKHAETAAMRSNVQVLLLKEEGKKKKTTFENLQKCKHLLSDLDWIILTSGQ